MPIKNKTNKQTHTTTTNLKTAKEVHRSFFPYITNWKQYKCPSRVQWKINCGIFIQWTTPHEKYCFFMAVNGRSQTQRVHSVPDVQSSVYCCGAWGGRGLWTGEEPEGATWGVGSVFDLGGGHLAYMLVKLLWTVHFYTLYTSYCVCVRPQ